MKKRDDPLTNDDYDRIARKLWGAEVFDADGNYYPTSSDEIEAILRERLREMQAEIEQLRPHRRWAIQDIQLELIRRTSYNALDGEQVRRDLLERRSLWEAALLDTWGLSSEGPRLPARLIKLRDLTDDFWNADTLYVLARNLKAARQLARLEPAWGAMAVVHGKKETADSLGTSDAGALRLVTFWWD